MCDWRHQFVYLGESNLHLHVKSRQWAPSLRFVRLRLWFAAQGFRKNTSVDVSPEKLKVGLYSEIFISTNTQNLFLDFGQTKQ